LNLTDTRSSGRPTAAASFSRMAVR
jgi:hypothetical protein